MNVGMHQLRSTGHEQPENSTRTPLVAEKRDYRCTRYHRYSCVNRSSDLRNPYLPLGRDNHKISDLLLDKDLNTNPNIQSIVRARTLAALHILNTERKAIVLRFLNDSVLLRYVGNFLYSLDLSYTDLNKIDLSGANLSGASLAGANLTNAILHEALQLHFVS